VTDPAGSALHDTIARAFVKARAAVMPHEHAAADARLVSWFDGIEDTITALTGPLLGPFLDHPDVPPEVKALLTPGAAPEQANELSVILLIVGALVFPLIQGFLTPAALNAQQTAWQLPNNQVMPLSAPEVALGVLKNTLDAEKIDPYAEARRTGYDTHRLNVMTANTGDPPGIAELLQAYRRQIIDVARLEHGVRQSRLRDEWFDVIQALRYAPPPAGEVVAGRVKEHLTDADYRTKLAEAGTDPANAEWLRLTAGRPYGIEQALHLWNRGVIDAARVREVVAQSDVNTDFLPDIEQLRWYVPPVRSVMAMLRSGAITDAQATTLFTENGVRPEDIAGYLAEAHHTKATAAKELSQAQTLRMYGARFIDRPTASARLERLGYDPATVGLLLDFADEAQHERFVNAVVTRIHARFVAYKLTEPEAAAALTADGIPVAAQADLLKVWKIERDANLHVLSPASITAAYRRKQIDAAETKRRLLAVGVQDSDLAIVVADAFAPTKPNPAAVQAVVNA
jgi:hypothetical protein